eukprot:scaffold6392_cov118-Isochrysis_galbana.AAC.4
MNMRHSNGSVGQAHVGLSDARTRGHSRRGGGTQGPERIHPPASAERLQPHGTIAPAANSPAPGKMAVGRGGGALTMLSEGAKSEGEEEREETTSTRVQEAHGDSSGERCVPHGLRPTSFRCGMHAG